MMIRQVLASLVGLAAGLLCAALPEAYASPSIRVLLASEVQRVELHADNVIWATDERGLARMYRSSVRVVVRREKFMLNGSPVAGDRVTFRAGDQDMRLWLARSAENGNGSLAQSGGERSMVQVSGHVQLVRRGKGFWVINQVELEEYVKGVVPSEVSSSWHPEMLKAQAVAARTYALYQQMLSATREYDVAASIQDQVYRGRQGIDERIEQAVESTKGLVITHQGAPIYAAFSSTAAGLTEDAMVVWSKDLPYLKGVECPFDLESPHYQWKASFKLEALEQNLRQQGFAVGTIATFTPLVYSRAGRVATIRILHSKGELILRGEDLRKAVGYTVVPSTQFTIESFGSDIVLAGYGAGHAVGLCQWGAKELAELGYSFSSILRYYYPGTELQNASQTHAPPVPTS